MACESHVVPRRRAFPWSAPRALVTGRAAPAAPARASPSASPRAERLTSGAAPPRPPIVLRVRTERGRDLTPQPLEGRRMVVARSLVAAIVGGVLLAAPLGAPAGAQAPTTGTVTGTVVDSASQQPLSDVRSE